MIRLTETHIFQDATDTLCPFGYAVVAYPDWSRHGGDAIVMVRENILFDELLFLYLRYLRLLQINIVSFNCLLLLSAIS